MRSLKYGYALLALTILFPLIGHAEEPELRGYTPPPMFGNSMSVPVDAPPAPAPEVKSSPVKKIETPKVVKPVTKPPADKELVVKDTPLPIQPLTPKAPPPKPTTVPEKNKIPPYVPPKPEEKLKKAEIKSEPKIAAPTPKAPATGNISAESLLSHPVTSGPNPMPAAEPINPLAVPASKVEGGLPLPGSAPTQKSVLQKSKAAKKAPVKKETKKTAETVKKKEPVKKAEAKKPAPKKVEPKTKAPEPKPKPVVQKEPVKPVPVIQKEKPVIAAAPPVTTAPKQKAPYNVKGSKSMPKVSSTKVDKTEIGKLPLPAIAEPSVKTMPTKNEMMIDKALEDHLVEPDVKKIIAEPKKEKAAAKSKLADTPVDIPTSAPVKAEKKTNPSKSFSKPELISLEFSGASADLAADQKNVIDSSIIPRLKEDDSRRLQILSFASPAKEGQSSARRISLSRGLAIRSYLLEKGVQPSRIDIRALGDNTKEKPMDRVDLALIYLR